MFILLSVFVWGQFGGLMVNEVLFCSLRCGCWMRSTSCTSPFRSFGGCGFSFPRSFWGCLFGFSSQKGFFEVSGFFWTSFVFNPNKLLGLRVNRRIYSEIEYSVQLTPHFTNVLSNNSQKQNNSRRRRALLSTFMARLRSRAPCPPPQLFEENLPPLLLFPPTSHAPRRGKKSSVLFSAPEK